MSSLKQKAANQQNAQKSTGPRPESYDRTRINAMTHGAYAKELMAPGEEEEEYQALLGALIEEWRPATPTEELEVVSMAKGQWLARRCQRLANGIFAYYEHVDLKSDYDDCQSRIRQGMEVNEQLRQSILVREQRLKQLISTPGYYTVKTLSQAFPEKKVTFDRLYREEARAVKMYYHALRTLQQLQAARTASTDREETPGTEKVTRISTATPSNTPSGHEPCGSMSGDLPAACTQPLHEETLSISPAISLDEMQSGDGPQKIDDNNATITQNGKKTRWSRLFGSDGGKS